MNETTATTKFNATFQAQHRVYRCRVNAINPQTGRTLILIDDDVLGEVYDLWVESERVAEPVELEGAVA